MRNLEIINHNFNFTLSKIQSLRTTYREELRKVKSPKPNYAISFGSHFKSNKSVITRLVYFQTHMIIR